MGDWGDLAKMYGFTRSQCTFTHKEHQMLSGLHVYMASLKKERLTSILVVLYISPSAQLASWEMPAVEINCSTAYQHLSASAWETYKVPPS